MQIKISDSCGRGTRLFMEISESEWLAMMKALKAGIETNRVPESVERFLNSISDQIEKA